MTDTDDDTDGNESGDNVDTMPTLVLRLVLVRETTITLRLAMPVTMTMGATMTVPMTTPMIVMAVISTIETMRCGEAEDG